MGYEINAYFNLNFQICPNINNLKIDISFVPWSSNLPQMWLTPLKVYLMAHKHKLMQEMWREGFYLSYYFIFEESIKNGMD